MKQDLEKIVGKENVSVAKEVLAKYSRDFSLVPSGMQMPLRTEDVG